LRICVVEPEMNPSRPLPPLSLPFALLGLLLAHLTMCILQTAVLDEGAHWIGLAISASMGLLAGWIVPALPRRRRGLPVAVVLASGALVGMLMQWVLLVREPLGRAYMLSSGIGTSEPILWVGAGAFVGIVPALVLVALYAVAARFYWTTPAQDAWERIMAPFAAAAAILGAGSFAMSTGSLRVVAALIVLLAMGASTEIMLRDRSRARWLRRVLAGQDPEHELVPLTDASVSVPLAVGTVEPRALVVRVIDQASYRSAARDPVVRTTHSLVLAIGPLRQRRLGLLAAQATAVVVLGVGMVVSGG
jgi:hypothetical protein